VQIVAGTSNLVATSHERESRRDDDDDDDDDDAQETFRSITIDQQVCAMDCTSH
jgi:hypothetical protein